MMSMNVRKHSRIYIKHLQEDPPVILMAYTKVLSGTNARVEGFEPNGYRGISSSFKI